MTQRTLIGTVRARKNSGGMDAGTIAPTAPTKMSARMYTGVGWKRKTTRTDGGTGWYIADPPESASCDEPNT